MLGCDPVIVLFNDRNFGIGQVFTLTIGAVMFLPLLLLPLLLQRIAGYPPLEVGYLLMPRGIGSVIGLIVMSQIRDKFDPRPMIFIGILLTAWPRTLATPSS